MEDWSANRAAIRASGANQTAWAIGMIGQRSALFVTLGAWCRDGEAVGTGKLRSGKARLKPLKNRRDTVMSKAMVIFILLASGTLYDPQRVLSQLGPEASAIGYTIKHEIPGIRAS